MKAERIRYLTLAGREYGMAVDRKHCPPSHKGVIKHLLRQGYLTKSRIGPKMSRYSIVRTTIKGARYLEQQK